MFPTYVTGEVGILTGAHRKGDTVFGGAFLGPVIYPFSYGSGHEVAHCGRSNRPPVRSRKQSLYQPGGYRRQLFHQLSVYGGSQVEGADGRPGHTSSRKLGEELIEIPVCVRDEGDNRIDTHINQNPRLRQSLDIHKPLVGRCSVRLEGAPIVVRQGDQTDPGVDKRQRARGALERARRRLADEAGDIDIPRANRALMRAKNRISIAESLEE